MADIKTREVVRGTIKTFDRAGAVMGRIKTSAVKSREESVSEYAENRIYGGGRIMAGKLEHIAERSGRKNAEQTVRRIAAVRGRSKTDKIKVKNVRIDQKHVMGMKALKKKKQIRKAQQDIRYAKSAGKVLKKTVITVGRSVKYAFLGAKALVSVIIAGGWISVIIIFICCLFGAAVYFFGDSSTGSVLPVSREVEQYSPVIDRYAKEYSISEYTDLIKAVMMQESAGKGSDPMQASECGFNTKYPRNPGGITDPDYSIKCGVQMLASVLKEAGCKSPADMPGIRLALQGYNFGSGYISWAKARGGYSKANALEFSRIQAKKAGMSSYGDSDYVEHVLRYYPYNGFSDQVVYTGTGRLGLPIQGMKKGNITSPFGARSSPGGIGSKNHRGIDIGFPTGTHVLACEAGTVESAGWNGGFGNCIIISHGGGLKTVYAHLSRIHTSKGQKVVRGQFIGEVGSTGNSTGPHLHLGVKLNGNYVNPEKGWLSIP